MDFRAQAREEVRALLVAAGRPRKEGRGGRDERHGAIEAWVARRAHELAAEWLAREGPPAEEPVPREPADLLAFLERPHPPPRRVCFVCHGGDHESDSCAAGVRRARGREHSADSRSSAGSKKRRGSASSGQHANAGALANTFPSLAGAGKCHEIIAGDSTGDDAVSGGSPLAARDDGSLVDGQHGGTMRSDLRRLELVAASLTAVVTALSSSPAPSYNGMRTMSAVTGTDLASDIRLPSVSSAEDELCSGFGGIAPSHEVGTCAPGTDQEISWW